MNIIQSGFAVNFRGLGDTANLAFIISALGEGIEAVEVSEEAEAEWVGRVVSSPASAATSPSCTPGYYNNEGNPGRRVARTATSSVSPASSCRPEGLPRRGRAGGTRRTSRRARGRVALANDRRDSGGERMATAVDLDQLDFIEPDGYVNRGYPHDVWTRLRAEAPVYWFDRSDGHDFWAITKHEDIVWISKRPELFISDPTLVVQTTPPQEGADLIPKNLIQFGPPKHGVQRKPQQELHAPRSPSFPRTSNESREASSTTSSRRETRARRTSSSRSPRRFRSRSSAGCSASPSRMAEALPWTNRSWARPTTNTPTMGRTRSRRCSPRRRSSSPISRSRGEAEGGSRTISRSSPSLRSREALGRRHPRLVHADRRRRERDDPQRDERRHDGADRAPDQMPPPGGTR